MPTSHKTHLLIGLGTAAAEAGYRVRYTLASKLANELVEAGDDKQLSKTIARCDRVDLSALTSWDTWNPAGSRPSRTDASAPLSSLSASTGFWRI
jgi:hypothetical protein